MKKYWLILLIIHFCYCFNFAQNSELDSLKKLLLTEKRDTVLLEIKGSIGEMIPILRIGYWDSLAIDAHQAKSKKHEAFFLLNAGYVAVNQGDIIRSVKFYEKSLKLFEQLNNQKGLSNAFNNLGFVYESQEDYENALVNYKKGLDIRLKNNLKKASVTSYNNIGSVYLKLKQNDLAESYFDKGLKIAVEIKHNSLESQIKHNLGISKLDKEDYKSALQYFEQALKIRELDNDEEGISYTKLALCKLYYFKLNQKPKGKAYGEASLVLAKRINFPEAIRNSAEVLCKVYIDEKEFKKAYDANELFHFMKDSINNDKTRSASIRHQLKYDYEKQAAADSVTHSKESEIKNAEIAKQNVEIKAKKAQQYFLFGGLTLVLIFAIFIFNRFKLTQKQKHIIEVKSRETESQKHIIEEKHKEITDSINYAERIQRSFLASDDLLSEKLKNYFVLFQPKDVVSGDFYWAASLSHPDSNQNLFYLVTADSTGHGVPGAIMSLLNITSIESALKDGNTSPADILNATRKTIVERLKKDGSVEGGKDGMDCSLICFDFANNAFTYAAANNPVWVVRENQLIELAPDKMPVGKHDKDQISFTQHEFHLQKGDTVYALTDGLPDQFGGPNGKKYKYKQLKELLTSIATLPMPVQKEKLKESFVNWKGDLEQVDDVCVIGIRV